MWSCGALLTEVTDLCSPCSDGSMSLLETLWAHMSSLQGSPSPDFGSFLSPTQKAAGPAFQSERCYESGLNQPCC